MATDVFGWAVQYAISTVLSTQTGVRAFLPMFILSLVSLVNEDLVELDDSMQWIRHPATASAAGVIAVAEIVADHIPFLDHALHAAMTFVHPVLGVVMAIAPKLGDTTVTEFVQAPMAIFGGGVALIFHLIKVLVRLCGCGCLTPVIATVETLFVALAVPLAISFGVLALVLAVAALLAIVRYLIHTCRRTGQSIEDALFGEPGNRSRRTLNYVRRNHLALNLAAPRRIKHLERPVRAMLLMTVLVFHLYMVAVLLPAGSNIAPLSRVVLVALAAVGYRSACTIVASWAAKCDPPADPAAGASISPLVQPRAALAVLLVGALTLWGAIVQLTSGSVGFAKATVDFLCAVAFSLCAFEPLELLLLYRCCGCCPCCDWEDNELADVTVHLDGATT